MPVYPNFRLILVIMQVSDIREYGAECFTLHKEVQEIFNAYKLNFIVETLFVKSYIISTKNETPSFFKARFHSKFLN